MQNSVTMHKSRRNFNSSFVWAIFIIKPSAPIPFFGPLSSLSPPADHAPLSRSAPLRTRTLCKKLQILRCMRYCKTKGIKRDQGGSLDQGGGARISHHLPLKSVSKTNCWFVLLTALRGNPIWNRNWYRTSYDEVGAGYLPTHQPPSLRLTIHQMRIEPQRPHTYTRHLINFYTPKIVIFKGKLRSP